MFADMHPSIMLATMAIFLAMIVILNALLYKPLLKFMDERSDSIKNDENKVRENSQEMLGVDDELRIIHDKTRDEINSIKQNAIAQARQKSELVIKAKKDEIEQKMAMFYKDLELKRTELKEKLLANLPDFKQSLQDNISKI